MTTLGGCSNGGVLQAVLGDFSGAAYYNLVGVRRRLVELDSAIQTAHDIHALYTLAYTVNDMVRRIATGVRAGSPW